MTQDIKVRNFHQDLAESNNVGLLRQWDKILKAVFGEHAIIAKKDDLNSQLDFGVDYIVQSKDGRRHAIDVKTRRNEFLATPAFLFEIIHQRYDAPRPNGQYLNSEPGWVYKSCADVIGTGWFGPDNKTLVKAVFLDLMTFKDKANAHIFGPYRMYWTREPTLLSFGQYQYTGFKLLPLKLCRETARLYKVWGGMDDE